jgi:hypothetical protein
MVKIFDSQYYVDIDKIDEIVTIKHMSETGEQHISVAKYEMIKTLLDVILTEEEKDETLGFKRSSIPFKIAFNSLLYKKIINKID